MESKRRKLSPEQIKFVEENMPLVSIAIKKMNIKDTNIGYDDIYQVGYLGLCKAVLGYDKNKKLGEFSTYAVKVITRQIHNYIFGEKIHKNIESGYLDNVHDDTSYKDNEIIACEKISTPDIHQINSEFVNVETKMLLEKYFKSSNITEIKKKKMLAFFIRQQGYSCEEAGQMVGAPENSGRNWALLGQKLLQECEGLKECLTE